jgi:glycosyltransferase involved in cell wall biosynthesis
MSSPAVPALVLSPTPPLPEVRARFVARYGADTAFADLPALRRTSLRAGLRSLVRSGARVVVVTAPPHELGMFRDYLVVLSFFVPRAERRIEMADQAALTLGLFQLVRALARIAAGMALGGLTMFMTRRQLRGFGHAPAAVPRPPVPGRCLYLKPFLSFGPSVGGSVAHVAGVANALARAGGSVHMLSSHRQPLVVDAVDQTVVPPPSLISFPFEVNQYRYQRVFLRAARALARRGLPDFIYQRYALNDLSGIALRRELGIPLVLEFNGSEIWAQRHWGQPVRFEALAQAVENANLRQADLVVVVSQPLVDQAVALGADPERVLFYPNGIDPGTFDPARFGSEARRAARASLGVPADADLLTFVGTFGTWHGTDVLAAAIRRLIDEDRAWLERRRAHFLFVGDGARGPRVREILGTDVGGPFVTLAGLRPQAETPGTLAASDILLSPHVPNPDGTPFFGSPTKLFEYMAMARPIVASDLDQIGWVLKGWRPGEPPPGRDASGRTRAAVLVEPGSVDSLVSGIRRAVELGREEREALGAEARRLVTESFTWDRNVAAVLERLRGGAGERTP